MDAIWMHRGGLVKCPGAQRRETVQAINLRWPRAGLCRRFVVVLTAPATRGRRPRHPVTQSEERLLTGLSAPKVKWAGRIVGVQPRIRLTRSFDQRSHEYLGYVLFLDGTIGDQSEAFTVGVGPAAHAKFQFQVGGHASGEAVAVQGGEDQVIGLHRASKLRYHPADSTPGIPPPWHEIPPPLAVYRARGHRRLSSQSFGASCRSCQWAARMPVVLIIDQWHPEVRRYRTETFCYGPKTCPLYRSGPTRKVPGRKGMTWEEEDWVDDDATSHRADNE
jgi:hypothetical protein